MPPTAPARNSASERAVAPEHDESDGSDDARPDRAAEPRDDARDLLGPPGHGVGHPARDVVVERDDQPAVDVGAGQKDEDQHADGREHGLDDETRAGTVSGLGFSHSDALTRRRTREGSREP